jgi:general secretion pathway protein J
MKRSQAGFTLLEMMVALVVFGLVMAGIGQTFKFGLMAWRQGPIRTAEPENLAALDAALSRIISQTQPGSMVGGAGQLAFTTALPPRAGHQGANAQAPLADAAILTQNGTLILRYRPHPAGIPLNPAPPPIVETLATGVTGFSAAYLARKRGGPFWTQKWKAGSLPLLVRLHIELADGRDWPDLIVAPVAGGG